MALTDEARVRKLHSARQVLSERKDKLEAAMWAIEAELLKVAAKALERDDHGVEGGDIWECDDKRNPIGMCVYDGMEDPCWDECLFCGEPYERK